MGVKAIRATGELLITAGLVILMFVGYVLYGTGVHTANAQNVAGDKLEELWTTGGVLPGEIEGELPPDAQDPDESSAAVEQSPGVDDPVVGSPRPSARASPGAATSSAPDKPAAKPRRDIPIGTGIARLRIPRLGADYQWVIGEGVTYSNLKEGPGHYPGTALPGQVGNFVLSGHRTTYGAPFGRFGELESGDAVVVETAKNWYTYRVRAREIVDPSQVSVLLPVPNQQGVAPTERLMTLTTCHPQFSAKQRLILYAVLDSTLDKASGARPPALGAA